MENRFTFKTEDNDTLYTAEKKHGQFSDLYVVIWKDLVGELQCEIFQVRTVEIAVNEGRWMVQ